MGELQHQLQGAQQEQLQLRGQVLQLQQQLKLLGGNLNGHLSLAQGSVVSELQQLLQQRDTAVAASEARLQGFAWQLDRICEGYNAQLAAEQQERARLSTEAAQARLLSIARGRQVAALQADLDEVQQQLTRAQAAATKGQSLQQEQQEGLRQQLLEAQAAAAEAREAAAAAKQAKVAAEGGTLALRQQVAELQTALTDKQLQVEWLEGKVADLTDAGRPQPLVSASTLRQAFYVPCAADTAVCHACACSYMWAVGSPDPCICAALPLWASSYIDLVGSAAMLVQRTKQGMHGACCLALMMVLCDHGVGAAGLASLNCRHTMTQQQQSAARCSERPPTHRLASLSCSSSWATPQRSCSSCARSTSSCRTYMQPCSSSMRLTSAGPASSKQTWRVK